MRLMLDITQEIVLKCCNISSIVHNIIKLLPLLNLTCSTSFLKKEKKWMIYYRDSGSLHYVTEVEEMHVSIGAMHERAKMDGSHVTTLARLQSNITRSMQHAKSPPFGHSNTQDRAGRCCSSAESLAPTWPRRSLNTPTALTLQTLKSGFPRHTSPRTKEDEVEEPRLSSARTWEGWMEEVEVDVIDCRAAASEGRRWLKLKWWGLCFLGQKRGGSSGQTHVVLKSHTYRADIHPAYAYTPTEQTNPDLENLCILSVFLSCVHPCGSNCVSVSLHVREKS